MRTITLTIVLIWLCGCAVAQAWRPADGHDAAFWRGVATGIAAHEMGHLVVATAKGYDVGLHNLSIVYPGAQMSDADHLQVASAGLQTQWLLSELLLRQQEAHPAEKMPSFSAGMVASHLLISAAYLTVLKDHEDSDLVGIASATGLSTDTLAVAIAVPAALDAWRLTGKDVPSWGPQLSAMLKGAGLVLVWTY